MLTMCLLQGCHATGTEGGGGLHVGESGTTVTLYGVSFAGNTATHSGPDILLNDDGATLTINSECAAGEAAGVQGAALVTGGVAGLLANKYS